MSLFFSFDYTIKNTDLHGTTVGHDKIISILYNIRENLYNKHGNFSESNVDGLAIIITRLNVQYKYPAYLLDKLSINMFIGKINRRMVEWQYKIYNLTQGEQLMITASTQSMFYCNDTNSLKSMPKTFEEFCKSS